MSETRSWIRSLRTDLPPLLLLAALSFASVGFAGGDARAQAKAAFQEAQAQFDRGHYQRALEGYRRAYALAPLPALLYDAAQCERKLRRWSDAERDYRRFLEAAPDTRQRPLVLSLIEEMHAKAELARLKRRSASPRRSAASAQTAEPSHPAEPLAAAAPQVEAKEAPPEVASASASTATAPEPPADAPLAPSLTPVPQPAGSTLATSAQEVAPATPLYKKWWFWGGVAAVAAGTVTAIAVASHDSTPANTSLGQVDLR